MRWTARPVSFQWKLKKNTDNKALKIGIVIGRILELAEIQSYLIQEKMARLAKPHKEENFETGGVVYPEQHKNMKPLIDKDRSEEIAEKVMNDFNMTKTRTRE